MSRQPANCLWPASTQSQRSATVVQVKPMNASTSLLVSRRRLILFAVCVSVYPLGQPASLECVWLDIQSGWNTARHQLGLVPAAATERGEKSGHVRPTGCFSSSQSPSWSPIPKLCGVRARASPWLTPGCRITSLISNPFPNWCAAKKKTHRFACTHMQHQATHCTLVGNRSDPIVDGAPIDSLTARSRWQDNASVSHCQPHVRIGFIMTGQRVLVTWSHGPWPIGHACICMIWQPWKTTYWPAGSPLRESLLRVRACRRTCRMPQRTPYVCYVPPPAGFSARSFSVVFLTAARMPYRKMLPKPPQSLFVCRGRRQPGNDDDTRIQSDTRTCRS